MTKVAILGVLLFGIGPLAASVGVVRPLVGFGMFALGGLLGLVALVWGGIAAARGRAPWTAPALGLLVTGSSSPWRSRAGPSRPTTTSPPIPPIRPRT